MKKQKRTFVINAMFMKDFLQLVPTTERVFINLTGQDHYTKSNRVPIRSLFLKVTGQAGDQIARLAIGTQIMMSIEKEDALIPWNKQDASLVAAYRQAIDLTRTYLQEKGYTVLDGELAIPASYPITRGHFEHLIWEKDDNKLFSVRLATPAEQAEL